MKTKLLAQHETVIRELGKDLQRLKENIRWIVKDIKKDIKELRDDLNTYKYHTHR